MGSYDTDTEDDSDGREGDSVDGNDSGYYTLYSGTYSIVDDR